MGRREAWREVKTTDPFIEGKEAKIPPKKRKIMIKRCAKEGAAPPPRRAAGGGQPAGRQRVQSTKTAAWGKKNQRPKSMKNAGGGGGGAGGGNKKQRSENIFGPRDGVRAAAAARSLTVARGVVGQRTSFPRPLIVGNLTHDYRVYEGGRCQGGLTQSTELQFLDGKGFTVSLFPGRVRGRRVRAGAVGGEALRWGAGDGGGQGPGLRALARGGGGLQPGAGLGLGEEGVARVPAGPLGPADPRGLLGQQDGVQEGGVDPVQGAAQRAVGGGRECGGWADGRGGGGGPGGGEGRQEAAGAAAGACVTPSR